MNPETFIKELEQEILEHEAVHHPFLKRFATEKLTIAQVQTFGLQHYQLVKIFVNYMTNLLPRIPGEEAMKHFRTVFEDEFGQHTIFRSHPALYRSFLKALGLGDAAWGKIEHLPETVAYIEGHTSLTRDEDFLIGLGVVGPGHEFSIPTMFGYLISGFRNNTNLTEEQFEYFSCHMVQDIKHAVIFNEMIVRHVETKAAQDQLREGTLRSLSYRMNFWDGLERAVFG
ncbi:MAG: iron-containing redox enzyme family protein [Nitrospira sp.]|nr:iron-containing redox enzyme family protein [Candidatus Manganitrophaceae bacterium]HIL35019.1 iron-containing redox enzyme family protein [Candidatus Manganitrophaceae bacterium]